MLTTKKEKLFFGFAGIFITCAIVAELISCKQADIGLYPIIAGIVPWPVVFLLTDVLNEYYGKRTVRRLSWFTCLFIALCFLLVFMAVELPTSSSSYATDAEFRKLFGGSLPIMIGSITAFALSQWLDVWLFWLFKGWTGDRFIWLRATGSTVISQLADSYIVLFIGFWLPGNLSLNEILFLGITGYFTKLVIAVALTPLIYLMRFIVSRYLGEQAKELTEAAIQEAEMA